MKQYTLWRQILAWIGFVTLCFTVIEILLAIMFPNQFVDLIVKTLQ